MRIDWRWAVIGLLSVVLFEPTRSEAQSLRALQSNVQGTDSAPKANNEPDTIKDSKTSREDRSADGKISAPGPGGIGQNNPANPPQDPVTRPDEDNSPAHVIQTLISGLRANIYEFMQSWEHGPDALVPEFMASDAEINAALTKVLHRKDHKQ